MKTEIKELLDECSVELDEIENIISNRLTPIDKTKAYLTKYALIKASGTLEFAFRSMIADYFIKFNIPQIDNYLNNSVRGSSSSVKYDNICQMLGKFDDEWSNGFKMKISAHPDGQRIIQSAASLVTNRHSFAHGIEPSATFSDIKQYFDDVLKMINELDSILS